MPNAKHSTIKVEHFTPPPMVEAARNTMGSIDLDPFSCDKANEYICASKIYTKETNGLIQKWEGNVFANVPGGKAADNRSSLTRLCLEKAISEYQSGNIKQLIWIGFSIEQLALSDWFLYFPICFCNRTANSEYVTNSGRIKFLDGKTFKKQSSPTHSSFISYWYNRSNMIEGQRKFASEFSKFGTVIKPQLI